MQTAWACPDIRNRVCPLTGIKTSAFFLLSPLRVPSLPVGYPRARCTRLLEERK
jgi:hypothetical protein